MRLTVASVLLRLERGIFRARHIVHLIAAGPVEGTAAWYGPFTGRTSCQGGTIFQVLRRVHCGTTVPTVSCRVVSEAGSAPRDAKSTLLRPSTRISRLERRPAPIAFCVGRALDTVGKFRCTDTLPQSTCQLSTQAVAYAHSIFLWGLVEMEGLCLEIGNQPS